MLLFVQNNLICTSVGNPLNTICHKKRTRLCTLYLYQSNQICKIQNYLRAAGRASVSSVELNTSKSEETEETKQENSEVKISKKKKLFETCSHPAGILNAELLASPKGAVAGSRMNVPPSMRRRVDDSLLSSLIAAHGGLICIISSIQTVEEAKRVTHR